MRLTTRDSVDLSNLSFLLLEFDFTAARGIGDLQKELLLSGCPLVLLEPSKDVHKVLKGALTKVVPCVNNEPDLDSLLSELLASENHQLKDVVVPLLMDKERSNEKSGEES